MMTPILSSNWIIRVSIVTALICIVYSCFPFLNTHNHLFPYQTSLNNVYNSILRNFAITPDIDTYNKQHTKNRKTFHPESPENASRPKPLIGTEKATMFMLVRNEELKGALETMRKIEDRFNRRYHYPWTFLNDKPFTEEFIQMTTAMASGKVEHGLIQPEHWSLPDHIDEDEMDKCMEKMTEKKVVYGNSLSYRHMCRFNSGFFYNHELMQKYDYYWRVEPDVHYFCDQLYDPFTFMRENNKKYGFVITFLEYPDTVPTLWNVSKQFLDAHPDYIAKDSALDFVTDNNLLRRGDLDIEKDFDYNLCHFWSNFEIADLNFFRSKQYSDYFEHLDKAGGFFYERWGDAPVHTIGVAAFLNKSEIHRFDDIGYQHNPYFRCPKDRASHESGRCLCPQWEGLDMDYESFSCFPKWWHHVERHYME